MKKWLHYFLDIQKQQALHSQLPTDDVEYGSIIYQSAEFLGRVWLVADYHGEFNVFVDQTEGTSKPERRLAATFRSRERAVSFAMEMFLITCGRLKRANRWSFHRQNQDPVLFD